MHPKIPLICGMLNDIYETLPLKNTTTQERLESKEFNVEDPSVLNQVIDSIDELVCSKFTCANSEISAVEVVPTSPNTFKVHLKLV